MEQVARAELKAHALRQMEARISAVQQSIREQTGLNARRRDIIMVAEQQVAQMLMLIRVGVEPSRFSDEEIRERVIIMEEVIAQLYAVPEAA